ncbi:uncharacterized protein BX663DRAFT_490071 [Cokeromyces recurvatus]|uniref:uncharacterized protein n=1 Tax=Cokeromyces recurvatus TaxID=90255 RepID=UPI00221FA234|nr:uncharacterized protein BX663DRAFT_490071 [Cokeromyces recurvatus]KAI7898366.1 hypothetical protein BX663DRAFT_490071 [Cokeromyces recurvatus]
MRISPFQPFLTILIIFQIIFLVESQLLTSVSNVLDSITGSGSSSPTLKDDTPPSSQQSVISSHISHSYPTQSSSSAEIISSSTSIPSASSSIQANSSSGKSATPTDRPSNDSNPTSSTLSVTSQRTSSSSGESNLSASSSSLGNSSKSKTLGKTSTVVTDNPSEKYNTLLPVATNDSKFIDSPNDSNKNTSGSKAGIIIGAVVGSIFGVALVGGILTWINRHGGCARRTKSSATDFEDYGLADTDFPTNNFAGMQSINGTKSPTIPRLNDQGNFYNSGPVITKEDPYSQYMTGYQKQTIDNVGHPATVVDYNNMSYNTSQQAFYYPQQQQQQQQQQPLPQDITARTGGSSYYEESGGYYHDNTSQQQRMYSNQPTYLINTGDNNHYYKPDQVDQHHQLT